jgi:hypothetical protein
MRQCLDGYDEVARMWVRRSQDHGYSKGKRMYFNGATIFSYGAHFPAAQFRDNDKGETCIIVTTRTYSSTTSGHMSIIRGAAERSSYPVLYVPDVPVYPREELDHEANMRSYRHDFSQAVLRAKRARVSYRIMSLTRAAAKAVEQHNAYCGFFGLPSRMFMPDDLDATYAELKLRYTQVRNEALIENGTNGQAMSQDEMVLYGVWPGVWD